MTLLRWKAAALLAAAAIALYVPALGNGFAYDDVAVIQLDSRVHSVSNAPAFFTQGYWADADLALYRPLTTLSFAVDWSLSGGDPAWFLFVNALWNAAACVLAFMLLLRFAGLVPAFGAALLFAVHPVHVEAVANIVGRADLGAAVFVLSALNLWPSLHAENTRYRIAAVGLLFALALLMKESAIMLPALVVLLDVARGDLRPSLIGAWARRRLTPLLVLALIAVTYLSARMLVLGGMVPARLDAALEVTSGADRLFTALQAWPVYLRLLFMPIVLLADYGPRVLMPADLITPGVLAGAIILLLLITAAVQAWRRGFGVIAFTLLWFPLTIVPVSNLIIPIGVIVAERTLYLPSFALALAVALIADGLLVAARLRPVAATVLALVITMFATRTLIRIPDWRSTDTIMAALLRDRPDSFRAHWHHARVAAASGQHESALEKYVHALELWPYRRRLVSEAARAAIRAGNLTYARELARYGYGRWPADMDVARLYVAATIDLGDTTAARGIITDALQRSPGDSLLLRMQHAITGTDQ